MDLLLLDASILVSIFCRDPGTEPSLSYLKAREARPAITDFSCGELGSAVSVRIRSGQLAEQAGRDLLALFDTWALLQTQSVLTTPEDLRMAATYVRQVGLKVRMPDALYLATATRLQVPLLTADKQQAFAGRAIGLKIEQPQV